MPLSTQVAAKDRQSASLYPTPLTTFLGLCHLSSTGIVVGIVAFFVHYLRIDSVSVPVELIVVRSVLHCDSKTLVLNSLSGSERSFVGIHGTDRLHRTTSSLPVLRISQSLRSPDTGLSLDLRARHALTEATRYGSGERMHREPVADRYGCYDMPVVQEHVFLCCYQSRYCISHSGLGLQRCREASHNRNISASGRCPSQDMMAEPLTRVRVTRIYFENYESYSVVKQ